MSGNEHFSDDVNREGEDYFDIEVEDVAADLKAKLPSDEELTPSPENAVTKNPKEVVANLDLHAQSAAAGAPYPTEEPDDPDTIWSPRPGVIGSKNQGFRKVRKL